MQSARQGQTGAQKAVEAEHLRLYNEVRSYSEIAADLHAGRHSFSRVAGLIFHIYRVSVSGKTAALWVRKAQEQKAEVPV